jgi:hypothetical protein
VNEEREIIAALGRHKAKRDWDRANPVNPICAGCDRRDDPDNLLHGFCAECRDTLLLLKTGCRFALSPCCGSEVCRAPLEPHEETLVALYRDDPGQFDWIGSHD